MSKINPLKAKAVADFAASVYDSADAAALAEGRATTREEMVLSMAADGSGGGESTGILPKALRERVERMTGDYAEILKRIDRLRVDVEGRARRETGSTSFC